MKAAHPAAAVAAWAEDEHRLGLKPVRRRVWAPRGQRPVARVARRYAWLDVDGFVRPGPGRTWWGVLPPVREAAFALALAEFAREEGSDATHRAVLAVDQAGWPVAAALAVPAGLQLVFLPRYSPELQPAARRWALGDEPVANRAFADRDEREAVRVARCRTLRADPPTIRAHTRFHWWPTEHPGAAHQ